MRNRTVTFLVTLVVLAGSANALAVGSAGSTATARHGPSAVDAPTARSGDPPPGVNESGVANATALLAAHRAALSGTGYAFRLVANTSIEGRYESRAVSRGTVATEFAPFRIRSRVDAEMGDRTVDARIDTWGNETVVLARYDLQNRTVYRKTAATLNRSLRAGPFATTGAVNVAEQASQSSVVEFALRTGEFEVASVESRDGRTLTTLRATGYNGSFAERGPANVSRYDAALVVDDRGLVHRASVTLASPEANVSYDFELTAVGSVVPYPRWAGEALATVNARIDVTADSRVGYFAVVNRGGDALPRGSEIRVTHAGANATLTLTDSLAPGERVYVSFPTGGGRPVLAADRPSDERAARLVGEYGFEIVDPNGNPVANVGYGFGSANATAAANATASSRDASDTTTAAG